MQLAAMKVEKKVARLVARTVQNLDLNSVEMLVEPKVVWRGVELETTTVEMLVA